MRDDSHSTKALQGVEIEALSELNNGDILVVKDGKWVQTGEGARYTSFLE